MVKKFLLMSIVLLSIVAVAQAEAPAPVAEEAELGVTLDLTYTSRWLSKGAFGYGQQGGFFSTTDIDFYGTGFGVKVTHRNATASGYVDSQRFDYRPYFKNVAYKDETYAMTYNMSVGYEHYYGLARTKANTTWEYILALTWPKLLDNGLVPYYTVHYETPASSGNANRKIAGWVHRFGMKYKINCEELPSPLKLSSEVGYYDGLGGFGSDWAYWTTGLSTSLKVNDNLSFVPGIYYQVSLGDNVNSNDLTYSMLKMKYKF